MRLIEKPSSSAAVVMMVVMRAGEERTLLAQGVEGWPGPVAGLLRSLPFLGQVKFIHLFVQKMLLAKAT